jgi:formyl-CoA transferase/succinyl-CoA--D-citramalate CoA-transferase
MKLLDSMIEEWTKTLPAKEALAILEEKGVPSGLIYTAKDIVEDPQYQEREMIIKVEHPQLGEFPMPGIVPKLSRTPGKVKNVGPEVMGKHNVEVYQKLLGFDDEKLKELQEKRII